MNEVLPAGKTTKKIILELAEQGLSAPEIARQTGIKYNTVYFHLNPDKCKSKKKKAQEIPQENLGVKPGWNTDRHACKTCQYRMKEGGAKANGARCNYVEIAKHSRGCEVEDCDKYVKSRK